MTNEIISENFSLLSKLLDIHNENAFKAKSYANAAFQIDRLSYELHTVDKSKIQNIQGIGVGVANKVIELFENGTIKELDDLVNNTPVGIMEMLNLKGIGPKKISAIWKEMRIDNLDDLLEACNNNILVSYKGFGDKVQSTIKSAIEFYNDAKGKFLYSNVEEPALHLLNFFRNIFLPNTVRITGQFRRQLEIIDYLEFIVDETKEGIKNALANENDLHFDIEEDNAVWYKLKNLKIKLHSCTNELEDKIYFKTSGSEEFVNEFATQFPNIEYKGCEEDNDKVIFDRAQIQYIPAFMRETKEVIELAKNNKLKLPLQLSDIKGVIHNHSKWSDGANTIEQMAMECIRLGYEYFVISDHSKIATYASGLSEESIMNQHKEIDELNKKLSPFKIFKSIECDILNDGSLDYDDEVLASFDFVIASIHSNLKMEEEKAMQRIITAIENPFTSILGHMTGRLLLMREGYPLDIKKVVDACAANNVVIELNANPRRLDIDWRWINYALENDVLISINPDAHSLSGIGDIRYGVLAAQKAGLQAWQNLSSFSLSDFNEFLMQQYEKR